MAVATDPLNTPVDPAPSLDPMISGATTEANSQAAAAPAASTAPVAFDPERAVPAEFHPARAVPADGSGAPNPYAVPNSNSMYRWDDGNGNEIMSKNLPPEDAKPYVTPTGASSWDDNFDAAVGKTLFVDPSRAVHQIALHIGNHLGLVSQADLDNNQADVDAQKKQDQPLLDAPGGTAGSVAGNVAKFAVAATLAPETIPALLAAPAAGATIGALEPTATGESRAGNAAAGGTGAFLGSAAGAFGSKLVTPVIKTLKPLVAQAAQVLEDAGVPLDAVQKTGSKVLGALKSFGGGSSITEEQQAAYNAAALKTVGADATTASPEVMGPAMDRIKSGMDDLASRGSKLDPQLDAQLTQLQGSAARVTGSKTNPIQSSIDDIRANASANGGALNGEFLQQLRSDLGDMSGVQATAKSAPALQDALDDATERANPGDVAQSQKLRGQYRAALQIQRSIDENNNIVPSKLYSTMDSVRNSGQSVYGKGDQTLMSLATAGKQMFSQKAQGIVAHATELLGPGAIPAAIEAYHGNYKSALAAEVLGMVAKPAARFAITNPATAGYLTNGVNSPLLRALAPALRNTTTAGGYTAAQNQPPKSKAAP